MKYRVEYQRWNPESYRPFDYRMNEYDMESNGFCIIPNVGDYISFVNESNGEQGIFRVRSKLFTHAVLPGDSDWTVTVNIVVEEDTADKFRELVNG